MIRPFTLLTAILAASAGAYLFAVKHKAQVLDDQLAAVAEQSRLDGQRIRVLQAQWALEIDPNRLNQLATQFTTLQPMKPAQLVTLGALKQSLPAPGTLAPGQNPEGAVPDLSAHDPFSTTTIAANGLPLPPPAMPAAAAPAAVAVASVAAPVIPAADAVTAAVSPASAAQAAADPATAPVVLASAIAAPRPVKAIVHHAAHPALYRLAQNLPAPRPYSAAALPAPRSDAPQYAARSEPPMGAQVMTVRASAAPPPVAAAAPGGSVLGMASNAMAPPQPFDGSTN